MQYQFKLKNLVGRNIPRAASNTLIHIVLCLTILTFISLIYLQSVQAESKVPAQWGVSSGHRLATQAGMQILKQGGNAIDAAIATAYALGVVEPYACGLGGGGIMLIYLQKTGTITVIDYREQAPAGFNKRKHLSTLGVGVPGIVKGLEYTLHKYGSLPRTAIMAPAISLADNGCLVSKTLATFLAQYQGYKVSYKSTPAFFQGTKPLRTGEKG